MPQNKSCNVKRNSWLFLAVLSWKIDKRFSNGEEKKNKVTGNMWHLVVNPRTLATTECQ